MPKQVARDGAVRAGSGSYLRKIRLFLYSLITEKKFNFIFRHGGWGYITLEDVGSPRGVRSDYLCGYSMLVSMNCCNVPSTDSGVASVGGVIKSLLYDTTAFYMKLESVRHL